MEGFDTSFGKDTKVSGRSVDGKESFDDKETLECAYVFSCQSSVEATEELGETEVLVGGGGYNGSKSLRDGWVECSC